MYLVYRKATDPNIKIDHHDGQGEQSYVMFEFEDSFDNRERVMGYFYGLSKSPDWTNKWFQEQTVEKVKKDTDYLMLKGKHKIPVILIKVCEDDN